MHHTIGPRNPPGRRTRQGGLHRGAAAGANGPAAADDRGGGRQHRHGRHGRSDGTASARDDTAVLVAVVARSEVRRGVAGAGGAGNIRERGAAGIELPLITQAAAGGGRDQSHGGSGARRHAPGLCGENGGRARGHRIGAGAHRTVQATGPVRHRLHDRRGPQGERVRINDPVALGGGGAIQGETNRRPRRDGSEGHHGVGVVVGGSGGEDRRRIHVRDPGDQGVDEVHAVGRAPAGGQIITRHGEVVRGAGGGRVVAGDRVMKHQREQSTGAEGVQGGVEEAHGGLAEGRRLLVRQRGEGRPQRRRAARAAKIPGQPIAVAHPDRVGDHGHIRHVAIGGGTLVGAQVHPGLVTGNRIVGAHPAAAAHAGTPVPDPLRSVSRRRARGEGGAAHLNDVRAVGGKRDQAGEGVGIARRIEKRLALGGHLLEHELGGGVRPSPTPGAAHRRRQVVIRDLAQDGHPRAAQGGFVNVDVGQARGHRHGHFDIQTHFRVAVTGRAHAAGHRHIGQIHSRQTGRTGIGRDVARVIPVKFHQRHTLTRPGQSPARDIGLAEIITPVGAAGAGPGPGLSATGHGRGRRMEPGLRPAVRFQPADVQHRHVQV